MRERRRDTASCAAVEGSEESLPEEGNPEESARARREGDGPDGVRGELHVVIPWIRVEGS